MKWDQVFTTMSKFLLSLQFNASLLNKGINSFKKCFGWYCIGLKKKSSLVPSHIFFLWTLEPPFWTWTLDPSLRTPGYIISKQNRKLIALIICYFKHNLAVIHCLLPPSLANNLPFTGVKPYKNSFCVFRRASAFIYELEPLCLEIRCFILSLSHKCPGNSLRVIVPVLCVWQPSQRPYPQLDSVSTFSSQMSALEVPGQLPCLEYRNIYTVLPAGPGDMTRLADAPQRDSEWSKMENVGGMSLAHFHGSVHISVLAAVPPLLWEASPFISFMQMKSTFSSSSRAMEMRFMLNSVFTFVLHRSRSAAKAACALALWHCHYFFLV